MSKVSVDSTKFKETLQELRRFKKMEIPEFVHWRAKIACADLIKWTPPRGKSPGSEGPRKQYEIGEKALSHDMGKMWVSAKYLLTKMERKGAKLAQAFRRYINQRNVTAIQKILRDLGFVNVSEIVREATEEQHDANRVHRTGRIARAHPVLVVNSTSINRLRKKKEGDIGKWKSGWGASAARLGVAIRDWPLWVRRHGNRGSILIQNFENSTTITMENDEGPEADERITDNVMAVNARKAEIELKAMMDAKAAKESKR